MIAGEEDEDFRKTFRFHNYLSGMTTDIFWLTCAMVRLGFVQR